MEFKINCTSCGASTSFILETESVCDYCGNFLDLSFDIFSQKVRYAGDPKFKTEFTNLIINSISSYKAGYYNKSVEYLYKCLKYNPLNTELIEFYVQVYSQSLNNKISYENYLELNRLYENYKKSVSRGGISDNFKNSLLNVQKKFKVEYDKITYNKSTSGKVWDSYTIETEDFLIAYIQISILCFDITKDENLLKEILFELSGHKKQHWFKNNDGIVSSEQFCLRKNFDPLKKRTELLEIHKGLNLSFEIPEIKFKQEYIYTNNNGSCFIATLCYEDINHRDIVTLRIFRDNHLSDKTIGKIFIFSYYTFGPIFIPIFKKNNNLRRFFKLIVLRNIILIIRKNFF